MRCTHKDFPYCSLLPLGLKFLANNHSPAIPAPPFSLLLTSEAQLPAACPRLLLVSITAESPLREEGRAELPAAQGQPVLALLLQALQKGLDSSMEPGCWRSKGVFPWCQACGSV